MSDMTEVFAIFKELQSTSKKTEKVKILKDNERNILFQDTLKWLLNPFVITGISSKKIDKKVSPMVVTDVFDPERFSWTTIKSYLENLNTGTDKDIAYAQAFLVNQPEEYREYYRQLITKSLKLGIDAKTVNSVYGKVQVHSACLYVISSVICLV